MGTINSATSIRVPWNKGKLVGQKAGRCDSLAVAANWASTLAKSHDCEKLSDLDP
jgi:hypothetical protein